MNAKSLLEERRSVRKFQDKKVSREVMNDIINTSKFAPSWANSQVVKFNIVESDEVKAKIVNRCYGDFDWNAKVLLAAPMVAVVSYELGKSGFASTGEKASSKGETWGFFDAGIATQQFVLAAYEKGIGSVIQGIFDEKIVSEILNLPENEVVACVIPFGYEIEGKHSKAPKRKEVEEISRYF
jgi:nitroreductase